MTVRVSFKTVTICTFEAILKFAKFAVFVAKMVPLVDRSGPWQGPRIFIGTFINS